MDDVEVLVTDWAKRRDDLVAVTMIGSQAQGKADRWSDWDFQLISKRPKLYRGTAWISQIGPHWTASEIDTFGNVKKVAATLEGGAQVDFVPLAASDIKLGLWMINHPGAAAKLPPSLQAGVRSLHVILKPGFKLIKGDARWHKRFEAIGQPLHQPLLTREQLDRLTNDFWEGVNWTLRKIARGEFLAARRACHLELMEFLLLVLEDRTRREDPEAVVRPEARKAEQWLAPEVAKALGAIKTGGELALMRDALACLVSLFEKSRLRVAELGGFEALDVSEMRAWFERELSSLEEDEPAKAP